MSGLKVDIDVAEQMIAQETLNSIGDGMWGRITDSFSQAINWAIGEKGLEKAGAALSRGVDKLDKISGNPTAQTLASAFLSPLGHAYAAHSLLKEKQRAEDRQQEQQTRRAQWAAIPQEQFKPVQSTGLLASAMAQAPQQQAMQQLALQQKLKEVR